MLCLLIQLLNIYTVRILRQQCEASITNARLSIKRNTQELSGCCAPRLTFTLLTIGSSARQRQLLLHQHVLPASHAPCVCVWHKSLAFSLCNNLRGLARRQIIYFVPFIAQQKTQERVAKQNSARQSDDQSFPGNRMKMTTPGIRRVTRRERDRVSGTASCKFNIEIKV